MKTRLLFRILSAVLLSVLLTPPLHTQNSGNYYLVFSARPSTIRPFSIGGHIFVSWGEGDGQTICSQYSLGFYPRMEYGLFAILFKHNTGTVESGFQSNTRGVKVTQMVVQLDSANWYHTLASAGQWESERYNLWNHNCLAYVESIAKEISMKTPSRFNLLIFPRGPVCYIHKLWRKNRKRSTKPTRLYFDGPDNELKNIILGPDDFMLSGISRENALENQIDNRARVEAGFFHLNFAHDFNH